MLKFNKTFIVLLLLISSCASDPKITVDPKSVKDMGKYQTDLKECKDIAMNFENKDAQTKSAALGAGAAVATTSAIVAYRRTLFITNWSCLVCWRWCCDWFRLLQI